MGNPDAKRQNLAGGPVLETVYRLLVPARRVGSFLLDLGRRLNEFFHKMSCTTKVGEWGPGIKMVSG